MKNIFTFLAFVISLSAFSQKNSNLIVFNNSGQQFFVILNGIKQNSIPKTNVKIEGLAPSAYKVKIIFADGKTGDIDKNIYLDPNMEYSAQVVIKSAKKRSLRLFDMVALNTSPYGNGSETVTYRPNDGVVYTDQQTGSVQTGTNTGNQTVVNGNGTANSQTITINADGTQTITTTVNGETTQVTTPVITPTANGQTTVVTGSGQTNTTHTHADGTVHDQNHNVITTTTANGQTTVVSGSGQANGTHTHADGTVHDQNHNVITKPVNGQTPAVSGNGQASANGTHTHADGTVHDHNHNPVSTGTKPMPKPANGEAIVNTNGTLTCNSSISEVDFVVNGIKEQSFSSDQMTFVKNALATKCINSDQAYRIVNAFTFDGDKIAMSKFCYDHMTDKKNASKLLDLFSFSSSKDELKKYFGITK